MNLCEARRHLDTILQEAGRELDGRGERLTAYLSGGKRLRGELVLVVSADAVGELADRAVRHAAFVEMVHAGGLCHDDVVDRSASRRGMPSIASVAGTREAVFVGLLLMVRAYALLGQDDERVRAAVSRAATRVARGQADEMAGLFDCGLSPEAYLERCRDKTGALFELSAELGALAARLGEAATEAVVEFARRLGLAFQLYDDLRDFAGSAVAGRTPANDLREGVYTLPVLLTVHDRLPGAANLHTIIAALRTASHQERERLIDEAVGLLDSNGAMQRAQRQAQAEVERALSALDRCPAFMRQRLGEFTRGVSFGATDMRAVA